MDNRLNRQGQLSAILYALFLIPSGMLLRQAFNAMEPFPTAFSHLIEETWRGALWPDTGISPEVLSWIGDGFQLITIAVLGWLFYQGWQRLQFWQPESPEQARQITRRLFLWGGIFAMLLMAVVPFHSSDLYGYINRGAQQVVFGVNPYQFPVAQTLGWESNSLFHAHWLDNPSPYPFFFIRVAQGVVALSGPTFPGAFLLFKLLNLLMFLSCGWLIYDLGRRLGQQKPWLSLYLFLWNPLLLLHTMGNGHNDILLITLLLASLWCLANHSWQWAALPILSLSILTKYASLLAFPFMLLYFARRRAWRPLLLGIALSIGLAAILAIPYLLTFQDWPVHAMVENAGRPQHSIPAALGHVVYYTGKVLKALGLQLSASGLEDFALSWIKRLFWLSFIGFYGYRLWRFYRGQSGLPQLIFETGLVLTVMVLAVSAKYHPWYVLMFFPVLLLLPESSRLRRFGVWISLFHLLAFSPLENLHIFNVLIMTGIPWTLALRASPETAESLN